MIIRDSHHHYSPEGILPPNAGDETMPRKKKKEIQRHLSAVSKQVASRDQLMSVIYDAMEGYGEFCVKLREETDQKTHERLLKMKPEDLGLV